jgi:transcriptional regulator with XRE-family HTH domain
MKFTPMQIQRLKNGMSQKDAAELYGISRSYLSQCETYDVPTPQELLSKMIKLYKCSAKELFPSSS